MIVRALILESLVAFHQPYTCPRCNKGTRNNQAQIVTYMGQKAKEYSYTCGVSCILYWKEGSYHYDFLGRCDQTKGDNDGFENF